jgi:hypothetical protein
VKCKMRCRPVNDHIPATDSIPPEIKYTAKPALAPDIAIAIASRMQNYVKTAQRDRATVQRCPMWKTRPEPTSPSVYLNLNGCGFAWSSYHKTNSKLLVLPSFNAIDNSLYILFSVLQNILFYWSIASKLCSCYKIHLYFFQTVNSKLFLFLKLQKIAGMKVWMVRPALSRSCYCGIEWAEDFIGAIART